jgi:hypothetical protein
VGFWLPETAVDDETLDVLAAEGIRFTVLAPHQVEGAPVGGLPILQDQGGRSPCSTTERSPTSAGSLRDGNLWAQRMPPDAAGARPLVAIATDGETPTPHPFGCRAGVVLHC